MCIYNKNTHLSRLECLYRNKQNLLMIVSGEGTGLGKKSTLFL